MTYKEAVAVMHAAVWGECVCVWGGGGSERSPPLPCMWPRCVSICLECPCVTGVSNGSAGNTPYADPSLTADYIVSWVQGAKDTYGLDIDYGGYLARQCLVPCAAHGYVIPPPPHSLLSFLDPGCSWPVERTRIHDGLH